ncbi:hypothetical protein [Niveibacterium sp.]|uniref:hypothetical protein n=1 Tax=Niveibacterium sp. TaxID=2017444 RepID=UPI0035B48121
MKLETAVFRAVLATWMLVTLAACNTPPTRVEEPLRAPDDSALQAALAFYAASQKPGAAVAPARPQNPLQQMQLAMQLGGGSNPDYPRALAQLDAVMRSDAAQAQSLQPLARLLHDQYLARQRAEFAADRASASAREAQRRADALQDKIDALAEIERSLPNRPARPAPRKESTR